MNQLWIRRLIASPAGGLAPLVFASTLERPGSFPGCHAAEGCPVPLSVGTILGPGKADAEGARFQVTGRVFLPGLTLPCPVLHALDDCPGFNTGPEADEGAHIATEVSSRPLALPVGREGYALAVITLSDKGFCGEREDKSGPLLLETAKKTLPLCFTQRFLLPDDPRALRALVTELALGQGYDLILTTGGTGLSPRDLTPEALLPALSRRLPGLEQMMMAASLAKTPHAALSRAFAGTLGACLVLALPGSRKAAEENFGAVLPALPHALEKLAGNGENCGG